MRMNGDTMRSMVRAIIAGTVFLTVGVIAYGAILLIASAVGKDFEQDDNDIR